MTNRDETPALGAAVRPGMLRLARARTLPVLLGPAAIGSAGAWAATGRFSWAWCVVALAGAVAGNLSFNVVSDVVDHASGADDAARADLLSVPTSSGAISATGYTARRAAGIGGALAATGLGCGLAVALARSPVALVLGAAAFAIALLAVVPPVRFSSRAPGSAEAATVLACMLQTGAAYAAQAERLDLVGLRLGIVPGLLVAAVVYHRQFLRYRADLAVGRPGTVARLGPERALMAGVVVLAAPFVALGAQAALGVWPALALVATAAVVPVTVAWLRVQAEPGPLDNYVTLFGATLGSGVIANVLLTLALVLR